VQEELQETARGILSQVTAYIDDVVIHMGSHKPDALVHLRMTLAKRGLDLFDELPQFSTVLANDASVRRKYDALMQRYAELNTRIYP
jgi:acyl carrier protein phosphodiesterase